MINKHVARTVSARWAIGGAALACGLGLAACSSSGAATASGASSKAPIQIGFVGTLSGPSAAPAVLEKQSLEVWSAGVNKNGGILGRQLQVQYLDDQDSAAQATQAVRKLTGEGVQIIFGPILFPEAVQPLESAANFTDFVLYPDPELSDPPDYPYTFNFYPPAVEDGVAQIADYLAAHGKTKWATVADTSPADASFQAQLGGVVSQAHSTVVAKISFDPSTTDFSAIVAQIKQSGAQAVALDTLGPAVSGFLSAMATAGVDLPVYGNATLAFADLSQVPASAIANTYVALPKGSVLQANGTPQPGYQALSKEIYARFGDASITGSGIPQQLDMFEAVEFAIEKAGGTDPAKIRSVLETQVKDKSFLAPGITYTISPTNHGAFPANNSALVLAHIASSTQWPGYHAPAAG